MRVSQQCQTCVRASPSTFPGLVGRTCAVISGMLAHTSPVLKPLRHLSLSLQERTFFAGYVGAPLVIAASLVSRSAYCHMFAYAFLSIYIESLTGIIIHDLSQYIYPDRTNGWRVPRHWFPFPGWPQNQGYSSFHGDE